MIKLFNLSLMLNELLKCLCTSTIIEKQYLFLFPNHCECPHSLLDRLLKSVDRYRVRAAYSTPSFDSSSVKNRSFLPLVTAGVFRRVSGAHYREPRFLRKGFFDVFIKKGDFGYKMSQNHLLLIVC
jgi:hypothetical protein